MSAFVAECLGRESCISKRGDTAFPQESQGAKWGSGTPQHRTANVRYFPPTPPPVYTEHRAERRVTAPLPARGGTERSPRALRSPRRRARCRSPAGPAAEGQGALPAAAERGGEPRGSAPPPLPAPPRCCCCEEEEEEEAAAARGGRGGAAGPAGACPLSAAPPRAELPQGPPRAPPPGRAARGMKLRPSGAGGPGCVSPAGP